MKEKLFQRDGQINGWNKMTTLMKKCQITKEMGHEGYGIKNALEKD
jgi:hypothetical protein